MQTASHPGDTAVVAPGGLVRYVVAATLVRSAAGGAPVGVLLLVIADPHVTRPGAVGGVLATCLSAPHLLGPLLARRLDVARDSRRLLGAAGVVYAVALAVATVGLGRLPLVGTAALLVVAGLVGPLLTGGLSSRLAPLVGPDERAQRRAEGWDAVTYGVGGTAGPAVVAAVAAAAGATAALLGLAGFAAVGALVIVALPRGPAAGVGAAALPVRQALRAMAVVGPLRRLTYATLFVAVAMGGVPVLTVALGADLRGSAVSGAALAVAFGVGNLVGSLAVTAFPSTGEPERLLIGYAVVIAGGFALCAVVGTYPLAVAAFGLLGAANGPFFAATLASRSAYAPAGARAQIFVTSAGLKGAAMSVGTALAGASTDVLGPRRLLAAGGVLVLATAGVAVLDRRRPVPALRDEPDRVAGPLR